MSDRPRRVDTLFWYGEPAEVGDVVELDDEETKHLRVFRVPVGGGIVLADGHGNRLAGIVVEAGRRSTRVAVESVEASEAEPPLPLVLGFPPLRSGRTETLLEKATELGVTAFVPLVSRRTRPGEVKATRWMRVIRSAAMQCGRCRLPELAEARPIAAWTADLAPDLERFAARAGGSAVVGARTTGRAAVVGPEGDFTDGEWRALGEAGFQFVDLGPRRLRAETAAIVLVDRLGAA